MEILNKTVTSGNEIYQMMVELCGFGPRNAGTPAAISAEKYIARRLKEAGVEDVVLEAFHFTRWQVDSHEVRILSEGTPTVPSDQIVESYPVVFSGATGPDGITAEMVYVNYGTEADFEAVDVKGRIALIENRMTRNKW